MSEGLITSKLIMQCHGIDDQHEKPLLNMFTCVFDDYVWGPVIIAGPLYWRGLLTFELNKFIQHFVSSCNNFGVGLKTALYSNKLYKFFSKVYVGKLKGTG